MSEKKNPLPSPARPGSMFGLLGIASTMGMHMISGPLAGGGIGWLVDRQLDSWPVGFGIGILLGIAAGFRNVWVDARRLERGQAEIDAAQAAERESRTAAAPGGQGRRNPGVPKRPFLPEKKHEQESTGSLREKHSGDALPDADKAWKAYAEPEWELTEEAGASAAADTERNRKNGASPGRTS